LINKDLRGDLLKKLKITKQALSQRVKKIKQETPMTTEEATYILAHREGLLLDKYLDIDTINKLRQIVPQQKQIITTSKNKKNVIKEYNITISGSFNGSDPLLGSQKLIEAKTMVSVYPLLYILENSIRQFICAVMEKEKGTDWWEKEVSKELKNDVNKRMQSENVNSWHQRRGSHPIDYIDMKDLPRLISKITNKIAPKIIPSYEWFDQLVKEIYISRCVLCHMNPLDKDSINSVKLRFNQWQKQMKVKKDILK